MRKVELKQQRSGSESVGNRGRCSSQPQILAHLARVGQQSAHSPQVPIRSASSGSWSPGGDSQAPPPWRAPASLRSRGLCIWRWWELHANSTSSSRVPACPCSFRLHTQLFFLPANPTDLKWFQTHQPKAEAPPFHWVLHQLFTTTSRFQILKSLSPCYPSWFCFSDKTLIDTKYIDIFSKTRSNFKILCSQNFYLNILLRRLGSHRNTYFDPRWKRRNRW